MGGKSVGNLLSASPAQGGVTAGCIGINNAIILLVYFGSIELIDTDGSTVFRLLGLAPGLEEDHMHV